MTRLKYTELINLHKLKIHIPKIRHWNFPKLVICKVTKNGKQNSNVEAYPVPCQTSNMTLFEKIVNS